MWVRTWRQTDSFCTRSPCKPRSRLYGCCHCHVNTVALQANLLAHVHGPLSGQTLPPMQVSTGFHWEEPEGWTKDNPPCLLGDVQERTVLEPHWAGGSIPLRVPSGVGPAPSCPSSTTTGRSAWLHIPSWSALGQDAKWLPPVETQTQPLPDFPLQKTRLGVFPTLLLAPCALLPLPFLISRTLPGISWCQCMGLYLKTGPWPGPGVDGWFGRMWCLVRVLPGKEQACEASAALRAGDMGLGAHLGPRAGMRRRKGLGRAYCGIRSGPQ